MPAGSHPPARLALNEASARVYHRIAYIIGSRYSTRSRFIRTAIEQLLWRDEGQVRLRAAYTSFNMKISF
jgi:metal-responsive CopG/Arc/MetJ family transcriptional regulator